MSFDTSAGGGQITEKAHLSGVPESPAVARNRPRNILGGKLK